MKAYALAITAAFVALLVFAVLHEFPTPPVPPRVAVADSAAVYRARVADLRLDSSIRADMLAQSLQEATRAGQRARWLRVRLDSIRAALGASQGVDTVVEIDSTCPDAAPAIIALDRCQSGLAIAKQQIRVDSLDLVGARSEAAFSVEQIQEQHKTARIMWGAGGAVVGLLLGVFAKY